VLFEAPRLDVTHSITTDARTGAYAAGKRAKGHHRRQSVPIVGCYIGGALALYAASVSPEIGSVVDFYGIHPNAVPDMCHVRGPVMGNCAALESDLNR
jgi:hypothetical protein